MALDIRIRSAILRLRGHNVMLDNELARLYGVDPVTTRCELTSEEIEQVRLASTDANRTTGPTNTADALALIASHRIAY